MKRIIIIGIATLAIIAGCASQKINPTPEMSTEAMEIFLNIPGSNSKTLNALAFEGDTQSVVPASIVLDGLELKYDGSYYVNTTQTDDIFETRMDNYHYEGTMFNLVASAGGQIWMQTVFTNTEDGIKHHYTIVDADGDTTFEKSYGENEEPPIPQWVKEYSKTRAKEYSAFLPIIQGSEKEPIEIGIRMKKSEQQHISMKTDPQKEVANALSLNNSTFTYFGTYYFYDDQGKVETRADKYIGPFVSGGFQFIYVINSFGNKWGYMVGLVPDDNENISNYTLLDNDGDGILGLKILKNGGFDLPNWVKN